MQEAQQHHVDRIFPPELSQWFTTPIQQTSILCAAQPTQISSQQNERTIQIPIMDQTITSGCETTDIAFVGYIMQPPSNSNHHQILEIQNISAENNVLRPLTRPDLNPNDYLSVVMVEPKIKTVSSNTEEKWEAKKSVLVKKQVLRSTSPETKPKTTELTVLEQRFHCQFCIKDFPSLSALMSHSKCSPNQKLEECSDCGKIFTSHSHFLTHKCIEKISKPPFLCQVCNIFFSDHEIFLKHELSHRMEAAGKYSCDPCGLEFSDANVHKRHLKIHAGAQFLCNVCDKTFSTSATFTAHKRVHTGERPFKCDLCEKRFFTKSHVQTHRRVHSGERPFACSFCGRAFADGSSHRRHEKLHQQNKKYQCEVCGRGFPLAISLSKHMAKQHSYSQ